VDITNSQKILVLIPAFNEGGHIGDVIEEVRRETSSFGAEVDILVVDDGSSDNTSSIAKAKGAQVIRLPLNNGIGVALQTGFRFALEAGYDTLIRVDGDGQHPARFIARLLEPVSAGRSDMVIGSRFIEGKGCKTSFFRRLGILWFSFLIRVLFHKQISDPTSGFQTMNKRVITLFTNQYASDYPEVEGIVHALENKLRIEETAIEMRPRLKGRSSIDWLRSIYYALKVTMVVLLSLIKE
jgi:glycosyltransferase involved in cell wall biosynthesis